MARLPIPDGDGPETTRALALRPELQAAVDQLERAVWKSCLPRRLHELVRMRVAKLNRCTVCMDWRNPTWCDDEALLDGVEAWGTTPGYTDAERLALEFAERFCTESTSIGDELIGRLTDELGADGVVDLTLVTGKYLALGRFMQVLGLDQACALHFDDEGVLVTE
jgi:alkylhydroperoxidase family enzyme